MNFLIVNQPTGNRGDEAAHRALVRALSARFPEAVIRIVFMGVGQASFEGLQVHAPNVVYENVPIRHIQKFAKWAFLFRFRWLLTHFRSGYRLLRKRIREADWVISAPSGICLGPFRSWYMLLVDWMVVQEKKPFAYYSPSFGPEPEGQKGDRLFWRECVKMLKRFDFLSIRDAKTMTFADGLGLRYVPAIDTAFLDAPAEPIPQEVAAKLGDKYVVFVPNSLTWHVAYHHASQEDIDVFYFHIMDLLAKRYPTAKIVLLPQLYGRVNGGDHGYFLRLRERYAHPERIEVLPDTLTSDIQQAIIAKAQLVVGARYHSIVFAINNAVPFCALSYEHKMQGLLKSLGAEDCMLDIQQLGMAPDSTSKLLEDFGILLGTGHADPSHLQSEASCMAVNCFASFSKSLGANGRNR